MENIENMDINFINNTLRQARDCDWSTIAKFIALVIFKLIALAGFMWVVRHF